MNVISILIFTALGLSGAAVVRLRRQRARQVGGVLCLVIGGSFSVLGLKLVAPAIFLGGSAHLAVAVVLGLERVRIRLTLLGALFAVSLSGLILVADAWKVNVDAYAKNHAERLAARAEFLGQRGGNERVRVAMVSDVPSADLSALGECALSEGADVVVLLDSEEPPDATRERLVRWTSKACGVPMLVVHPSSDSAAVGLRPYLCLVLAGSQATGALQDAADLIEGHRFTAVIAPTMSPQTEDRAREMKVTLLALLGDDLRRETKDGLHLVEVGEGHQFSRGGLLEATPSGLLVRSMQPIEPHRERARSLFAQGRMLLLAIDGTRAPLGALLLLCLLGFALPLALCSRPLERSNG